MDSNRPIAKQSERVYRRRLPHVQGERIPLFVTFVTRDRWVLPEPARTIVLNCCVHDHRRKLYAHVAIVMPDHVHMVFTPLRDAMGASFSLAEIMNGVKGASAHGINKFLGRRGPVWQTESFDHALRSSESLAEKVRYVCHNPVRNGLVATEGEWPWLWRGGIDDPNEPGC